MLCTRESVSSLISRVMVLLVLHGRCNYSVSSKLLDTTSWQVKACLPSLLLSYSNSIMLTFRSIGLFLEFLLNFDARCSILDWRWSISCRLGSSSVSTFWLMRKSFSRLIFSDSVGVLPLLECLLISSCTSAHRDLLHLNLIVLWLVMTSQSFTIFQNAWRPEKMRRQGSYDWDRWFCGRVSFYNIADIILLKGIVCQG